MALPQTRRRILSAMILAGASGLSRTSYVLAGEDRLETTTVRLHKLPIVCFAPQYVCEELLRAEGFTDIQYVETSVSSPAIAAGFAENKFDFGTHVTSGNVSFIDAGVPIAILSGVHAGCYELFGRRGMRTVRDLKGKRIGTIAASDLIEMMAAYVGLDPKRDLTIVNDPELKPLEQYMQGKLDAYMGLPPEPQLLHLKGFDDVIVRTAVDRPWSQYFCCTLAGRRDYVTKYPNATKRVIRAMLKAADFCAAQPERAARMLVEGRFTERYELALRSLNDNPYGSWREYDVEDTVRFYALRLRDTGTIKKTPQRIIAEGTDLRFFNEFKRELKA